MLIVTIEKGIYKGYLLECFKETKRKYTGFINGGITQLVINKTWINYEVDKNSPTYKKMMQYV